jgi:hypothetical protein
VSPNKVLHLDNPPAVFSNSSSSNKQQMIYNDDDDDSRMLPDPAESAWDTVVVVPCYGIVRSSSVKDRISELESAGRQNGYGSSQTQTPRYGDLDLPDQTGLVQILANQFEAKGVKKRLTATTTSQTYCAKVVLKQSVTPANQSKRAVIGYNGRDPFSSDVDKVFDRQEKEESCCWAWDDDDGVVKRLKQKLEAKNRRRSASVPKYRAVELDSDNRSSQIKVARILPASKFAKYVAFEENTTTTTTLSSSSSAAAALACNRMRRSHHPVYGTL